MLGCIMNSSRGGCKNKLLSRFTVERDPRSVFHTVLFDRKCWYWLLTIKRRRLLCPEMRRKIQQSIKLFLTMKNNTLSGPFNERTLTVGGMAAKAAQKLNACCI